MIPPLVSYSSLHDFLDDMREIVRRSAAKVPFPLDRSADDLEREAVFLWESGLPPIVSRRMFSLLLGISPRLIPRIIASPESYWREFTIPKRSGIPRTIQSPRVFLKAIQLYIAQNILAVTPISPHAFGFAKGRGTVASAMQHRGQRWLLKMDIQDFFPSVGMQRVEDAFHSLSFNQEVSRTLASLCTLRGRLPQGAPTSPGLADIVFREADREFGLLAAALRLSCSRYADDLAFSGMDRPPPRLQIEAVRVLERFGFRLNHRKTSLRGPGERHSLLGLVVNTNVHPSRETRRLLRAKFHNLQNGKTRPDDSPAQVKGWASYVNSYDKILGEEYLEAAKRT